MTKTIFVESSQFKQMLSFTPYVERKADKRKVKYGLLDQIKETLVDKWQRLKEGTRKVYDMLCFLGTELGFVYASDEYLAERHGISARTIRNRFKELIELGQVVKVYRRAKRCNGRGKPVYIFVNHPYFQYWKELLGLDSFHTDFQTENGETTTESKSERAKKVPTYSLPEKQESNINNKVITYVANRINDAIKKGTTIQYMSSYVDRVVRSLETQALYDANIRTEKARKQQIEANSRLAAELGIAKQRPTYAEVAFNYLEGE